MLKLLLLFKQAWGWGPPGMEDMLHFEPLNKRGKRGKQEISNVTCPLRATKHMLYLLSKSFKIRKH
jgi:hypothetical protein